MGATLNIAVGKQAYALTDRGTWLAFANKGDFKILLEGDPKLFNQYGAILVNPAKHRNVKAKEGQAFIDWLKGREGQAAIASYKIDGEQLFFPNAQPAELIEPQADGLVLSPIDTLLLCPGATPAASNRAGQVVEQSFWADGSRGTHRFRPGRRQGAARSRGRTWNWFRDGALAIEGRFRQDRDAPAIGPDRAVVQDRGFSSGNLVSARPCEPLTFLRLVHRVHWGLGSPRRRPFRSTVQMMLSALGPANRGLERSVSRDWNPAPWKTLILRPAGALSFRPATTKDSSSTPRSSFVFPAAWSSREN